MLLSIAIPAFNRTEELRDLLDSIKIQKCSDIEIIICRISSPREKKLEEK